MAYPSLRFRPSSEFYTTLDGDITGATDPINVLDNSKAPDAPGVISIDNEEILYGTKGVNQFSDLTRGYNNTLPIGHSSGRPVACPISTDLFSKLWDAVEYLKGETDSLDSDVSNLITDILELSDFNVIITTISSSDEPTPERKSVRTVFEITALAEPTQLQNPTGTLKNMDLLWFKITDDGTARAITYDNKYVDKSGMGLPDETVANKELNMLFVYNETSDTLDMISMAVEE